MKDKHFLFELDLKFDSGQIVNLSFAKECSNFVASKSNKKKNKSGGKGNKKNKSMVEKTLAVPIKNQKSQNISFKAKSINQNQTVFNY